MKAIIRVAEIRSSEEAKRREELMGVGLDKDTLMYLCLRWIQSIDIPLELVEEVRFRTLFDYANPVAHQLLPKSAATLKMYAKLYSLKKKKKAFQTTFHDLRLVSSVDIIIHTIRRGRSLEGKTRSQMVRIKNHQSHQHKLSSGEVLLMSRTS